MFPRGTCSIRRHVVPAQGDKEFNTEAGLLARLRHPHVVRLLGVCAAGDHRIAVTSLARGGSLRSALDRGALSWRARVAIALGVVRGVAYLHEAPLVHRDLTSANVLLDADGRAQIAVRLWAPCSAGL